MTSVLITGAAGDVGSAIATALAASRRALVLADAPCRNARLEETLARWRRLGAAHQMIGTVRLGRYGSPDEVASVVALLLSDAASYLTGVNVEVSGGSV